MEKWYELNGCNDDSDYDDGTDDGSANQDWTSEW